ncbi:MAG: acetyl-CoA carboxylase biotin carboxyl carrier protein [Lachnospiraceae bacterium]|nr:acetyl-CoA carboxylase biotin carboxyl carrier protein [Lachnospiraceae bacterium]
MDIGSIKELIKAVSESDLTALQVKEGNLEIKLSKNKMNDDFLGEIEEKSNCSSNKGINNNDKSNNSINLESDSTHTDKNEETKPSAITENEVKTPLVGTVYLAPSEEAEPFVKVGDKVKKGQTVAIVEAMKLMNDIESEFDGVISEILVENGQLVEYGQPLFRVV